MKKVLALLLVLMLALTTFGCDDLVEVEGVPADVKMGMAYFNAHSGGVASAVAVVDLDGKVLATYLDDIFYRNLNQGYLGLPGVETRRIAPYFVYPGETIASKKNQENSSIYGTAMQRAGSVVLPADNLSKIEQFAVGKTIAEIEAVIAKDIVVAKDEIQAATGATFVDNQGYLETILLAAKAAMASEDVYKVSNDNNVVLKQAYYNAHGSPAVGTVILEGDKIVASLLDEIYFFANDGNNKVFDITNDAKAMPKFVEGYVLSSKKVNGEVYAAGRLSGGDYVDQIKAIEEFANGKTISEIQAAVSNISGGTAIADVVSGATIVDTPKYLQTLLVAASPSLATGDPLAQHITLEEVQFGMAYFNAHAGGQALAGAVVDSNGTVVKAYLDEIFYRDITSGYAGIPGVDSTRIHPNFVNPYDTMASKKYAANSDIYGAAMARAGSTVLPADNLAKIEEFAVGKTIDELKAVIDTETAKDDIQAASGATFSDNAWYLKTIVIAAENALAEESFKVLYKDGLELTMAYYDAHGAPAIAFAVTEGNKVVKSYIDELYFFDNDGVNVVFEVDEAKSLPKFVEGKMLSSKKLNIANYGQSIASGPFGDQLAAIESFIDGKTMAELQAAYESLSAEGVLIADVVSGSTMRDTRQYIKAVMIAVDPTLAEGDERAQMVTGEFALE